MADLETIKYVPMREVVNDRSIEWILDKVAYLRDNTIPNLWGNANAGVSAFMFTIDGLTRALAPVLRGDDDIIAEMSQAQKRVRERLRGVESRLSDTEPRTANLAEMVGRIEQAYQAADQLPTDLQSLNEARDKIEKLLKAAEDNCAQIRVNQSAAATAITELAAKRTEATSVLEHCQTAYAAATSQGLAAAFTERSKGLAISMWIWTAAFTIALVSGAWFGSERVHEIAELLKNPAMTNWALSINLLLAVLSIGAPIWFGWMATKQINQRFRLSEDYAFKAAVSRAYEGYRREAARIDADMESKLLASALTRLDEQPLRFVEKDNYGSPWHELASSNAVQTALSSIPGFAEKIAEFARSSLQSRKKPLSSEE